MGIASRQVGADHNPSQTLRSIVEEDECVPVATFGAGSGGPVNAALFAARLLGVSDPEIAARVKAHIASQAEKVAAKDAALQEKLR